MGPLPAKRIPRLAFLGWATFEPAVVSVPAVVIIASPISAG